MRHRCLAHTRAREQHPSKSVDATLTVSASEMGGLYRSCSHMCKGSNYAREAYNGLLIRCPSFRLAWPGPVRAGADRRTVRARGVPRGTDGARGA